MKQKLGALRRMGFWWTFFGGHINIGKRITIFGANAMYWSLNIYGTRWGHIHIDLPTWNRIIGKRGWKIYTSPNGTPWACTWCIGTDYKENIKAQIRRQRFGHNFKKSSLISDKDGDSRLYKLNEKMDELFWI